MKRSLDEERNSIDLVTDSMYSTDFLDQITAQIFSPNNRITVIDFYDQWLKKTEAVEKKIPFSPGAIAGYLYCGLVLTREIWDDLLPKCKLKDLDPEWGLDGVSFVTSKGPKSDEEELAFVTKRLRNSVSHGNISLIIRNAAEIKKNRNKIHDQVDWTFKDVNLFDPKDTFEITLTMRRIETFIKKFHSEIHADVRSRM